MGSADAVLVALSRFGPALEEFRAASERPLCRFPVDYSQTQHRSYSVQSYLSILHNVGQVLQLRASALVALGRSSEALADIELICRFADALRQEPLVQSHRTRNDLIGFAIQVVWEGLASRRWSETELATLEKRLRQFTPLSDYTKAVRTESVLQMEDWERFRSILAGDFSRVPSSERGRGILKPFYPNGWAYFRAIAVYRFYQAKLSPVTDADGQRIFMDRAQALAIDLQTTDVFLDNRALRWTLSGFPFHSACLQVAVHQARLACALERCRLTRGAYPETLAALTPHFIEAIPGDVVNGDPFHCRKAQDGGFVLYSVGVNEKDDGGVARNELDWVWKYPND